MKPSIKKLNDILMGAKAIEYNVTARMLARDPSRSFGAPEGYRFRWHRDPPLVSRLSYEKRDSQSLIVLNCVSEEARATVAKTLVDQGVAIDYESKFMIEIEVRPLTQD